jgi:hypothetical protein
MVGVYDPTAYTMAATAVSTMQTISIDCELKVGGVVRASYDSILDGTVAVLVTDPFDVAATGAVAVCTRATVSDVSGWRVVYAACAAATSVPGTAVVVVPQEFDAA